MRLLICFLLLPLLACTQKQAAREQLLETDRQFARLSADSGAVIAFDAYLLDTSLALSHQQQPLQGKNNILAAMAGDYRLEWVPIRAEVAASGELGYTWGTYTLSAEIRPDSTMVRYGKYLNIWKKDDTGRWKLYIDMGNSSPGPWQPDSL